tara:strand:- start:3505 stop:4044 length:540 start_codon:yes stop_codon:yes gene_type:complete
MPPLNDAVNVALAVDVLTRLNTLSHENMERGLRDILQSVGQRLHLDRVALWDYDELTRRLDRIWFWQLPGTAEAQITDSFALETLRDSGIDTSLDVFAVDDIEAGTDLSPIRLFAPSITGKALLAAFRHRDGALSGALVFMMLDHPRNWSASDHAIVRLLVHAFDATTLRARAERRSAC